jgi:hypothetical protein
MEKSYQFLLSSVLRLLRQWMLKNKRKVEVFLLLMQQ